MLNQFKILILSVLSIIFINISFASYATNNSSYATNNSSYNNHSISDLSSQNKDIKSKVNFQIIKKQIENFIKNKLKDRYHGKILIEVKNLDKRLNLKKCNGKISYSIPNYSEIGQRTIVKLSCNDKNSWKLHLPVKIKVLNDVLVSSKLISKDSLINSKDLSIQKMDTLNLTNGYFLAKHKNEIIGKIAKFQMRAGKVISPRNIASKKIIKRGDKINIKYNSTLINVKTKGIALRDAGLNEKISVKNIKSKKILEGIVTAKDEIFVN